MAVQFRNNYLRPEYRSASGFTASRVMKSVELPGNCRKEMLVMVVPLSSLIERLDSGGSPDKRLDEDLRAYALTNRPDWPDHETPRLTARIDQAIALPHYLGVGWASIMRNIDDVDKWTAAAELARAGNESPFCRRFLIAVLNAAGEARS